MEKEIRGLDYLSLGLYAFGGLGIEALYAYLIEPLIYGMEMEKWNSSQSMIHWTVTCITWGIITYILVLVAKKKYNFNLFDKKERVSSWQWIVLICGIVFMLVVSYLDWNGFKVVKEFESKGLLLFVFQYIYYIFETALFMLIIVFGQRAFEVWFKKSNIPYGGIICGFTWGLAHMLTKSSVAAGLLGLLGGFVFGGAYLLLNRDIRKTYIALLIMFVF